MKITYINTATKKPATGDRRATKAHGRQIRVPADGGKGYVWRRPVELLGGQIEGLLTTSEMTEALRMKNAKAHAADLEAAMLYGTSP